MDYISPDYVSYSNTMPTYSMYHKKCDQVMSMG